MVVRLGNSATPIELDLWDKIVKRAERLDALTIEFVCENVSNGAELAALAWNSAAGSAEDPRVEFPVNSPAAQTDSLPKPAPIASGPSAHQTAWTAFTLGIHLHRASRWGGRQTRISAKGVSREDSGFAWLNQLSELLVALCESWPVGELPTAVSRQTAAYPLPRAA